MKAKILWICPECLFVQKSSKSRCDCGECKPIQLTKPVPYVQRTKLTESAPKLLYILEIATKLLEGSIKPAKADKQFFVATLRLVLDRFVMDGIAGEP